LEWLAASSQYRTSSLFNDNPVLVLLLPVDNKSWQYASDTLSL
jgi:hypothetical protein